MKKKNNFRINFIVITGFCTLLLTSCEKDFNKQDPSEQIPTLQTTEVTGVTQSTAICGGNITSDGGTKILSCGVCWSTNKYPTIANSRTSDDSGGRGFVSNISGLSLEKNYYVRAYAKNIAGIGYGKVISFKTRGATVTDIDGNVYNTVTIGTQVWMVENLRTTKLNDATAITLITDNYFWTSENIMMYCWYNNDKTKYNDYGVLYNWLAVGSGKLCPVGWHVPTYSDWITLVNYLGGDSIAGSKLKETGTAHWLSPNTDATNETGFTALPGGMRSSIGTFSEVGYGAFWWTSSSASPGGAWGYILSYWDGNVYCNHYIKKDGCSVRCIKD